MILWGAILVRSYSSWSGWGILIKASGRMFVHLEMMWVKGDVGPPGKADV